MLRKILENIFAENSKIRAVNKNGATPEDFVLYGFVRHLIISIQLDSDFNSKFFSTNYRMNGPFQKILMIAPLIDAFGLGNCDAQANLATCKLLLSNIEANISIVQITGKGRLVAGHQDILSSAPQTHNFVLINQDAKLNQGYLLDTWAMKALEENPGIPEYARRIGLTTLTSYSIFFSSEKSLEAERIQAITLFYECLKHYLTQEKLFSLVPNIQEYALKELEKYFPSSYSSLLSAKINEFVAPENLKLLHAKIVEAHTKWQEQFRVKRQEMLAPIQPVLENASALFKHEEVNSNQINSSPAQARGW